MVTVPKKTGFYNSFDGTPIYYEVRGSGPALVFIYGIACLMNHWHHQVRHFSKDHTVILFDIRGHHKSVPVQDFRELKMEAIGKDVAGLLDYLNIKKAVFAGHSFGGPVMLETYRQRPDLFSGIIFVNAFAKNPIKGMFGLDIIEPLYEFIRQQYQQNPDLWNTLWKMTVYNPLSMRLAALAGGFNIHLTHFKDIEVYARGVAQLDLKIFLALFEELMNFNGDDILPKISIPALIISGENDHVTPKKFQQEMQEKIPNNDFLLIPYGSHCSMLDFPDYVNLKIESYLRSLRA